MVAQNLFTAARRCHASGLDLLPNDPATKYPSGYMGWERTQFKLADIERHIRRGGALGLRTGNGIEALDLDSKHWDGPEPGELRLQYETLVEGAAPGLLARLVVAQTRSGGRHYLYRCAEIERNQKLAERPPTAAELAEKPRLRAVTLIETRGNGGQVQIAPSPGYELLQGDYAALPEITSEERAILLNCARALNRYIVRSAERPVTTGDRPGDQYNRNGGISEALDLLLADGWSIATARGSTTYLTRPGGTPGHLHASYGHIAPGIFYPFTSNCAPFAPETAYSPFAVKSVLDHGGDFSACARDLAQRYAPTDSHSQPTTSPTPSGNVGVASIPRFVLRTEDDLACIPHPEWLLKDELQRGGYHLIYGASGSGKTFYALDRALRAAATGARCIYIATEDLIGLKVRVAAWRSFHLNAPGRLAWLEMPAGIDLSSPSQVDELLGVLAGQQIDLITIDTLREAHTGDENSSQDMAAVNRTIQRLIRETGAAIDLVHHTGVNEGRERGSTALGANCDLKWKVSSEDTLVTISCEKFRHGAVFAPRNYQITPTPVVSGGAVLIPTHMTTDRATGPLSIGQQKVLEILRLSIFAEQGAKTPQIEQATDLHGGSLFRALSSLKTRGYVTQGSKGDPYRITETGQAAMDTLAPAVSTASTTTTSASESRTTTTTNQLPANYQLPSSTTTTTTTPRGGSGGSGCGQASGDLPAGVEVISCDYKGHTPGPKFKSRGPDGETEPVDYRDWAVRDAWQRWGQGPPAYHVAAD